MQISLEIIVRRQLLKSPQVKGKQWGESIYARQTQVLQMRKELRKNKASKLPVHLIVTS